MRHLERVLSKKKDASTHDRFLDLVLDPAKSSLVGDVWETLVEHVTVSRAAFDSPPRQHLILHCVTVSRPAFDSPRRLFSAKSAF
jgi:hypothetical protein